MRGKIVAGLFDPLNEFCRAHCPGREASIAAYLEGVKRTAIWPIENQHRKANKDILNLPEDRRHDRIVPRNPIALITLEDGTKMTCRIIDMSLSGAAVAAEHRPPLQSLVLLGKVQSRVVRNLEDGFALEFVHEQPIDTLEESVSAR